MKPIRELQVLAILNRCGVVSSIMELGGKIYGLPTLHPLQLKNYKATVRRFLELYLWKSDCLRATHQPSNVEFHHNYMQNRTECNQKL